MDLETNKVVDLLADRESATLAQWLAAHPGVETIARDRAGAYAQGARHGAPGAVQVADRWHMLRNCSDALLNVLDRRHHLLREVGASLAGMDNTKAASSATSSIPAGLSKMRRRQEENRARRQALFEKVTELKRKGWSILAVQRETGLDRKTVRSWLNNEGPGSWARKSLPRHPADAHEAYLCQRWQKGCRNARSSIETSAKEDTRGR